MESTIEAPQTSQPRGRAQNYPAGARPYTIASPSALRTLRLVAGAVVVVPLAGTAFAGWLASHRGISVPEFVLFAVGYALSLLGITVGFHRHFAHNAFKTSRPFRLFLAILGSTAGQGPLLWWVATHRRHHRHSDAPGDPHSPQLASGTGLGKVVRGFWNGHIGWMFSRELTSWAYFAPDLLRDRTLFLMHRFYFLWLGLGLAVPAAAGAVWMGGWRGAALGLLWGGLVRLCLVDHALWLVGSISHMVGSRPFERTTRDRSANNFLVAAVSFGEGLQNNHHAFPNSAAHALRWWEPDASIWVIRALKLFGVVWEVKHPSPATIQRARLGGNGIVEL